MRMPPDHFWDFMEDGDFSKFANRERQMKEALAEKIANSARWLAQITYNDGTPGESIGFEELDELHDIVERGPDWNVINKIVITLQRRVPSIDVACGKCGWRGKQAELGGVNTVGGLCYCPQCRANFKPITLADALRKPLGPDIAPMTRTLTMKPR